MIKTIINGNPETFDQLVNEFERKHRTFANQTQMINFKGELLFKATIFYKED